MSKINFEYNLEGIGWATGRLQIDDQILDFEVSYLCEPLTDLLGALVCITPGYAIVNIESNKSRNKAKFVWQGEPWGYDWRIQFNSFEELFIQIAAVENYFEYDGKGKVCFEATCNYYDFVSALVDELTVLIGRHGFVGYYLSWAGQTNFPIAEFLMLKHFSKTKVLLETNIIYPVNKQDKINCTQAVDLEYEIMLLTQNVH